MAIDRQGTGLAVLRICIGVFFLFEALGKLRWFTDSSILAGMLAAWHGELRAGVDQRPLPRARRDPRRRHLCPAGSLGEFTCGLALVVGFWTPIVAFVAPSSWR